MRHRCTVLARTPCSAAFCCNSTQNHVRLCLDQPPDLLGIDAAGRATLRPRL